jgi:hypothetical protein
VRRELLPLLLPLGVFFRICPTLTRGHWGEGVNLDVAMRYRTWNRPVTLDTIAAQLPNGFHHALLRRIAVDYVDRRATLALNVCVGDPEGETDGQREAYRPAIVTVSGLLWCIIEAPEANGETSDGLWIDAGPMSTLKRKAPIPPPADEGFAWWFFVLQWNAFIYIAGTDASLEWQDGQR